MKQQETLFSIVIPLYNKGKYIADTLASVLSQTYTDFEVIVVDDGSTDDGASTVKAVADSRVRYYYKDNGGVSSARNYGVAKANGEWIYILDADDIMMPNALEAFRNAVASAKGKIDIVTGSHRFTDSGNIQTYAVRTHGIAKNNYKWYFLDKFHLGPGRCLIRKEILQEYPYNESLSRFEDTEQALRMLGNLKVYIIPDLIFEYRHGNGALSRPCTDKSKDYTFQMDFKGKPFWVKCKMGELLMIASFTHPKERCHLLQQYKFYIVYAIIAKIKTSFSRKKWERLFSHHSH